MNKLNEPAIFIVEKFQCSLDHKIFLCNIIFDTQFLFSVKYFKLVKKSHRPPLQNQNRKLLILLHLSQLSDVPAGCMRYLLIK